MKKAFKLLILLLLFLPVVVFADCADPHFFPLSVKVINKNGTEIYDFNSDYTKLVSTGKKISYNETIVIDHEFKIGTDLYALIDTEYSNYSYGSVVNLKDFQYIEEVKSDEIENQYTIPKDYTTEIKYYVVKDTVLRKEPHMFAETVGTIPAGTTITANHISNSNEVWFYVKDAQYEGFFYTGGSWWKASDYVDTVYSIPSAENSTVLVYYKGDYETEDINGNKVVFNFNSFEPVTLKYYDYMCHDFKYYIEKDGQEGWIPYEFVLYDMKDYKYIYAIEDIALTENIDQDVNGSSLKLPAGGVYKTTQYFPEYELDYEVSIYLIEYEGKFYFAHLLEDKYMLIDQFQKGLAAGSYYKFNYNLPIAEGIKETIGKFNPNEEYEFVSYKGEEKSYSCYVIGYGYADNCENFPIIENYSLDDIVKNKDENNSIEIPTTEEQTEDLENQSSSKNEKNNMILYIVIGGLTLALIIVTTLLLKSRKKVSKVELSEETKPTNEMDNAFIASVENSKNEDRDLTEEENTQEENNDIADNNDNK